jgi:hypothetical protein
MMNQIAPQVTIGIIALLIVVFGFIREIFINDDYYDRSLKNLTIKGKRFALFGLVIVFLTLLSNGISLYESHQQKLENDTDQKKLEKDLKFQYDSSSSKIIKSFGEGMGKYGYMYDTSQKRIESLIRDSAKGLTNIYKETETDPVFQLRKVTVVDSTDTSKTYSIAFVSRDAASTGFDFNFYVFVPDKFDDLIYLGCGKNIGFDTKFSIDAGYHVLFLVTRNSSNLIYIVLRGSYENIEKSKKYKLTETYAYNKDKRALYTEIDTVNQIFQTKLNSVKL